MLKLALFLFAAAMLAAIIQHFSKPCKYYDADMPEDMYRELSDIHDRIDHARTMRDAMVISIMIDSFRDRFFTHSTIEVIVLGLETLRNDVITAIKLKARDNEFKTLDI